VVCSGRMGQRRRPAQGRRSASVARASASGLAAKYRCWGWRAATSRGWRWRCALGGASGGRGPNFLNTSSTVRHMRREREINHRYEFFNSLIILVYSSVNRRIYPCALREPSHLTHKHMRHMFISCGYIHRFWY
jgi:hypothetical protein